MYIPITFPLSLIGKTETRIAAEVVKIIAEPIPWNNRKIKSTIPEFDNPQRSEPTENIIIPAFKNFPLPYISDSFPRGINKTAVVNKYAVANQLNNTAPALNSFPMIGKATFIAEPINAVINEDRVIIINIYNLNLDSVIISIN